MDAVGLAFTVTVWVTVAATHAPPELLVKRLIM